MTKVKKLSTAEFLFFDRLLLVSLILTAIAYLFRSDWIEPIFTVAAIFTGVLWSYRTATNHPDRNLRLGAALIFALLATLSIYYLANLQNRI